METPVTYDPPLSKPYALPVGHAGNVNSRSKRGSVAPTASDLSHTTALELMGAAAGSSDAGAEVRM